MLVRLIELTQLDEGTSEDCSGDDIDATVADSPRKGVVAHGLGTAHRIRKQAFLVVGERNCRHQVGPLEVGVETRPEEVDELIDSNEVAFPPRTP